MSHGVKTLGDVLNWVIWAAFATELVVMLAVVRDRMGWLRKHPLEAAIVLLTAPVLPASLQALRMFRLLRVLRIAVLVKEYRRLFTLEGVRGAAVIAAIAAFGGGAIFSVVEKGRRRVGQTLGSRPRVSGWPTHRRRRRCAVRLP